MEESPRQATMDETIYKNLNNVATRIWLTWAIKIVMGWEFLPHVSETLRFSSYNNSVASFQVVGHLDELALVVKSMQINSDRSPAVGY